MIDATPHRGIERKCPTKVFLLYSATHFRIPAHFEKMKCQRCSWGYALLDESTLLYTAATCIFRSQLAATIN